MNEIERTKIIEKCRNLVSEMERCHGKRFAFAGLIEPEESDGQLVLVLAADWIDEAILRKEASAKVSRTLSHPQIHQFGGIIIIPSEGDFVAWFNRVRHDPQMDFEERNRVFFAPIGMGILFAHIFATQSPSFAELAHAA